MHFLRLMAAVTLAASTGCATIAHGTRQTVTVASDPSGAEVTVLSDPPGGSRVVRSNPGVTPIQLHLTRRDPNIVIRLERNGCTPAEVRLKRALSGWTFANLVFANPLAMQGYDHDSGAQYGLQVATALPLTFGLDFLSGGAYKLPKVVDVPLCRDR